MFRLFGWAKAGEKSADERYRLNQHEMNALLATMAARKNLTLRADSLERYFPVTHESGRKFFICPTSIDSASNEKGIQAKFFWSTIWQFLKLHPEERNCTLLIPFYLCRPFASLHPSITPSLLYRQHIVLLELDLNTKQLHVHDSQSAFKWSLYPDKIMETLEESNDRFEKVYGLRFKYNPLQNYHTYNMQESTFDCGYFVFAYVKHFLDTGSSAGLEELLVSIAKTQFKDKEEFLESKLGKSGGEEEEYADNAAQSHVVDDEEFRMLRSDPESQRNRSSP